MTYIDLQPTFNRINTEADRETLGDIDQNSNYCLFMFLRFTVIWYAFDIYVEIEKRRKLTLKDNTVLEPSIQRLQHGAIARFYPKSFYLMCKIYF